MKVLIELGEIAEKYVSNIPESSLPIILSNLLEEALKAKASYTPKEEEEEKGGVTLDSKSLEQLVEMISAKANITVSNSTQPQVIKQEEKQEIKTIENIEPIELGEDFDEFDMFK